MGWATKTNCDAPRPTLGNPASLLPYVYRPPALTPQAIANFCNNAPNPPPAPIAARPDPTADLVNAVLIAVAPAEPDITSNEVLAPCLSSEETSLTEPDNLLSGCSETK